MNKKIEIEISVKEVERKEMLDNISNIIDEPCQEISALGISYSEEDDNGGDIIKKISIDVTAKYINWKEILEKINELDDDTWQEISSLGITYSESED